MDTMQHLYSIVDENFIQDVDDTSPEFAKLVEEFLEYETERLGFPHGQKPDYILSYCPYCKSITFNAVELDDRYPETCYLCRESDPYFKIGKSIEKAKYLYNLILKDEISTEKPEYFKRIILEQIIVILATGLELFLRDIYSTTLNHRFIKDDKSMFERFFQDSRNKFTNLNSAKGLFSKDLGINLGSMEGQGFKKLKLLMVSRNAIVHNIGLADVHYIDQSELEIEPKTPIPIQIEDISEYILLLERLAIDINNKLGMELWQEKIKRFEVYVKDGLNEYKDIRHK